MVLGPLLVLFQALAMVRVVADTRQPRVRSDSLHCVAALPSLEDLMESQLNILQRHTRGSSNLLGNAVRGVIEGLWYDQLWVVEEAPRARL